jgi:diadenylate cyclase
VPLFRWQSDIDFLVLTAAFYALLRWAKSARAFRIALGVVGVHALALLASRLDLVITSWVLDGVAVLAVILLLLVFQPELRGAFMHLDRALQYWPRPHSAVLKSNLTIADAAFDMARDRLGALIVIVRRDSIAELLEGGVTLEAEISSELLQAVFQKTSPLHDGAVIVDGDRAIRAGVVLPLTHRQDLPSFYGTRHRAGMGLAERCDALVAVVSEERGEVTLMLGPEMRPQAQREQFLQSLEELRSLEHKNSTHRFYRTWFANIKLKLGAVGLAGVFWAMSFLAAGTTIRTVIIPIEFSHVPAGLQIADQSTDTLEVQLRGSPWVIDSVSSDRLIGRFDLSSVRPGWNSLQLPPGSLDLPPGVVVDRVTPSNIRVQITKAKEASPGG